MNQKLREDYDWIVLGDSPGALLSAVLAARLGLSTLVTPFLSVPSVVVSKDGHFLDLESGFIPGILTQGSKGGALFGQSLLNAGVEDKLLPHLIVSGDLFSVFGSAGNFRVTRSDSFSEMLKEVKLVMSRPLATGCEQIQSLQLAYWANLPSRLSWEIEKPAAGRVTRSAALSEKHKVRKPKVLSRSAQRRQVLRSLGSKWKEEGPHFLDQFSKNYDQKAVWEGVWAGTGESLPDLLTSDPFTLFEVLALGQFGADFRGGVSQFRNVLKSLAHGLGAHILETGECRRIFSEGGRLTGIQIAGKGKVITATGAVLGGSISQAAAHVHQDGRTWFRHLKNTVDPQGWKFSQCLVVQPELIPVAMSRRSVWKEEGAPAIEIEIRDPSEFGVSSLHKYVYLRTVMPWDAKSLSVKFQREIAARMYAKASEFFPFLEYNTVRIFPDFRVEGDELPEVFGFSTLDAIPEFLRVFGVKNEMGNRSGIDGLFVANQESYPDLGQFGAAIAGIEATAWIAHKKGLSGPFT